jgi:hypothetical protein
MEIGGLVRQLSPRKYRRFRSREALLMLASGVNG